MLIGISGKMGVGKTTCANIAADYHDAHISPFAGALKAEVYTALLHMKVIFDLKNIYGTLKDKEELFTANINQVPERYFNYGFSDIITVQKDICILSFRSFLQWYGTDYRRKQNDYYWIEKFLDNYNEDEFTVIDDVRFASEAEMVKSCGGFLIRINRKDYEYSNDHIAETELDNYRGFNLVITNNTTYEQFIQLCTDAIEYAIIAQRI